jgi:hypothetical protein
MVLFCSINTTLGAHSAGWRPCPNSCLKLSNHGWCYQNMPGKPDYLIWMNFPYKEPNGGGEAWSLDHLGSVIEYDGTRPVEKGECPTCHGSLFVGDPTGTFKKKDSIPVHPRTIAKDSQTVLGRPWVKLTVQASVSEVVSWYQAQLPLHGWATVDSNQVSSSRFFVITDGVKSKWLGFSPTNQGYTEIIMMSRF